MLHAPQTTETIVPLPTATEWTINGRGESFTYPGKMDEIYFYDQALRGDETNGIPAKRFLRGDCDGNGVVGGSPTEAIVLLNFAFRGAAAPPCLAACDAEANGTIGITDALRILRFAFLGIGEPDSPFPECGTSDLESDMTLGCATAPAACNP